MVTKMCATSLSVMRLLRTCMSLEFKRQIKQSRTFASTTALSNADIVVTPKEALLDHAPTIRVEHLEKDQRVTLWNTYTDDAGLLFSSHAHYVADDQGVVDVQKHMCLGGKYKGIFPEGLVTSLHAAPPVYADKPQLQWARLYKKNVEEPMKYTLNVINGHVSEKELFSGDSVKSMGEVHFLRRLMADGVKRTEIKNDKMRGVLFTPPGDGPFPVVLDLFGAESGIKEFRSAMLASYGYATLVLQYYGFKEKPELTDRLDLDYFLHAAEYLDSMPQGSRQGLGVVGSSKGGEIALTLCSLTDRFKACVTINCYNVSVDVDFYLNNKLLIKRLTLTKENSEIFLTDEGHLITRTTDSNYNWDNPVNLRIENIYDSCQVLMAASDEDSGLSYKSAIGLKDKARRLKKKNLNIAIYPGAGHLLDPPFHSHIAAVWNTSVPVRQPDGTRIKGIPHLYGGSPYAMCQATKDLWRRTLDLFHRKLVQETGLPLNSATRCPPY